MWRAILSRLLAWGRTLRVRFAIWVAGLLALALLSFGAFVYLSLNRSLSVTADESLQLSAAQVMAAVDIENGIVSFSDMLPQTTNLPEEVRERGLTIRVLDVNGKIIEALGPYQDLPLIPESIDAARQQRANFTTQIEPDENDSIRIYTAPIVKDQKTLGIVQVTYNLHAIHEFLNRLLKALLIGGPILTILGAFGSYFLVMRALDPIDKITRSARQIASADDLAAGNRLQAPSTNDEVGRLASTLDEMLARLADVFHRERQFTADASHELRTPLATMQAILEVICSERRTPEDYEQALDDIAEQAHRLRQLVETLLRLARTDAKQLTQHEPVDLSLLLQDVGESLMPLAEAKGLTLHCTVPNGLTLLGDSDGLIRLFVNLLDNAIKYTEAGDIYLSADLSADSENDLIVVTVRDTGMGIAEEHLPHLFDRFYRVDASRTKRGSGLGLAIAQAIVRTHGGTIQVESSAGKGTTFTVQLPAKGITK